MRTEAELQSMQRHPSGGGVADAAGYVEALTASPYNRFFDALEDLEYAVELHGPLSVEVRVAKERVERARTEAARTWRDRAAA
jgi:hypothetical protein